VSPRASAAASLVREVQPVSANISDLLVARSEPCLRVVPVKGVSKGFGGVGKGVFGMSRRVTGGKGHAEVMGNEHETHADVVAPVSDTSSAPVAAVTTSEVPPLPASTAATAAADGGSSSLAGPAPGFLRLSISRASIKGQEDAHPKVTVARGMCLFGLRLHPFA
jgi:hypothetical protein